MTGVAASKPVKVATVLLAGLAAGLAGLLLYQSQTAVALAGCGGDAGCDQVLASRWSVWFGIPVSLLAMLVYVGMLAAALLRDPEAKRDNPALDAVMALCGAMAILSAAWFILVQSVFIRSFCLYCMSTHAAGVAAAVLCLMVAWSALKPKLLAMASGVAVVLVGVLIVGQVTMEELESGTPVVQYVSDVSDTGSMAGSSTPDVEALIKSASNDPLADPLGANPIGPAGGGTGASTASTDSTSNKTSDSQRTGPRRVKLYGGRVEIDTTAVPVIGDPYATNVLLVLYDYTCSHCRHTRTMMEKTKAHFGDDLVIACLPTPLNSRCNRLIKRYNPANRYSCDLAEVSLAVWHAAPEKWQAFDKKIYSSDEKDLTPAKAKIAAWDMIGEKTLESALQEPWVKQQIARDVTIYGISSKAAQNSMLPMLITRRGVMNGAPRHPLDIVDLVEGKPVKGTGHEGHGH